MTAQVIQFRPRLPRVVLDEVASYRALTADELRRRDAEASVAVLPAWWVAHVLGRVAYRLWLWGQRERDQWGRIPEATMRDRGRVLLYDEPLCVDARRLLERAKLSERDERAESALYEALGYAAEFPPIHRFLGWSPQREEPGPDDKAHVPASFFPWGNRQLARRAEKLVEQGSGR
jgi:hypothetical protein